MAKETAQQADAGPGYRKIFRAATERAPAGAKHLFDALTTLWDAECQRLRALMPPEPLTGAGFHEMTGRLCQAAAEGAPKWKSLARRIDAAAKTDPAVRRAREDMAAAQNAYLKSLAPRPFSV